MKNLNKHLSLLANVMNHPSSEMFLYYQNANFRARTCTILLAVFPALQTGTVCTLMEAKCKPQ